MYNVQANTLTKFLLIALLYTASTIALAGTINGRVTDAGGQPISGLNVCLLERSPTGFGGTVAPESFLKSCRRTNASGDYTLVATSGNSSLVVIDEVDIQARQLNFIPEYHTGEKVIEKAPSSVTPFVPSLQDINGLDFKLDTGYRFRGKVTNEQNEPLGFFLVCSTGWDSTIRGNPIISRRCFYTNSVGEFSTLPLTPGTYSLFTYNDAGYVDLTHTGQSVMAAAVSSPSPALLAITNQDVTAVDFRLQRGYVLQGFVNDYKDRPASGHVCIYSKTPAADLQYLGCSSTNGAFRTPSLPPGPYVIVTANNFGDFGSTVTGKLYNNITEAAQTPVLITNADITDLTLYSNRAVHITGKVTDETDATIIGATVCFHRRDREGLFTKLSCTVTNINGSYSSARLPAGHYWLSAGRTTTPEVDHNGGTAPLSGNPDALSSVLDVGADTSVNFELKQGPINFQQSRSRALQLAYRVLYLNSTLEWNRASPANDAAVAAFFQELISVADAYSTLNDNGQIPDSDALDLILTAKDGLTLALNASEHGVVLDSAGINASISAVARLIKTLGIYIAEDSGVDSKTHESLRARAEELLRAVTRLRSLQRNIDDVHATNTALSLFINSLFSQLVRLENTFPSLLEQFAWFTGDAAAPALQQLLEQRGINAGSLESQAITAALKANPLLLQQYLKVTAVELNFDSDFRRFVHSLDFPPSTSNAVHEYFSAIGSTNESIWSEPGGRSTSPSDTIQNALDFEHSSIRIQDAGKLLDVFTASGRLKVAAGRILLVPPQVPDGIVSMADGSILLTRNSLSIQVVPAPLNVFALGSALSAGASESNLKNDGSITFDHQGKTVSATLSFQTDGLLQNGLESAQVIPPADLASNNPGSVFRIQYSNGSSQTLAPFVSVPGFFDSLSALGLTYQVSRETGVIIVGASSFRPAFVVSPSTEQESLFHQQAKDSEGIAYLPGDFNSDGLVDYKILDGSNTQIVYGIL